MSGDNGRRRPLSLPEARAWALMECLQRRGLTLGGIAEYCGNEDNIGLEDVPEWQVWIDKPTTLDQTRIEAWLSRRQLAGKDILHIGIGNSSLARRFIDHGCSVFGITIYEGEQQFAEAFALPHYDVVLMNKYSTAMFDIAKKFDIVVDNHPGGYVCCRFHFCRMMLAYRDLLAESGELVTAQPGWGWIPAPGAKHPRTVTSDFKPALGWDDWAVLADALGLRADRADEFVYTMTHGGGSLPGSPPGAKIVATAGREIPPEMRDPDVPAPGAGARAAGTAPQEPPTRGELGAVAQRLERVISELTDVKRVLLGLVARQSVLAPPAELPAPTGALQQKLAPLFVEADGETMPRLLTPFQEIAPGVKIGFEPAASLRLAAAPKQDPATSPADWKNCLAFSFKGGGWFSLEVHLAASELALGERYQFALCARPSRLIGCRLIFRGLGEDRLLREFRLHPAEQCYNLSGQFLSSWLDQADIASRVIVLAIFESNTSFDLALDYLNLYFA